MSNIYTGSEYKLAQANRLSSIQFVPEDSRPELKTYRIEYREINNKKSFINPWCKRKYHTSDKYYIIPKQTVNVFYNDYSYKLFYQVYSMKVMFFNRFNNLSIDKFHRENLYFIPYGIYQDKMAILNFIYGDMESLWDQLSRLGYPAIREIPFCTVYQGLVSNVLVQPDHVEFKSPTLVGITHELRNENGQIEMWSIDENFGQYKDLNIEIGKYRQQIGYRSL